MSVEANKAVVHRLYTEVWNERKIAVLDELVAPDYVHHSSRQAPTIEGLRDLVALGHAVFPDLRLDAEQIVAEGDRVAVVTSVRGTHSRMAIYDMPPTGKEIVWSSVSIFRLADGKIVEGWYESDSVGLLQQFGALPMVGLGSP